ncbi:uncharacterized protein V6R79_004336 [Siganus canaliculatus]
MKRKAAALVVQHGPKHFGSHRDTVEAGAVQQPGTVKFFFCTLRCHCCVFLGTNMMDARWPTRVLLPSIGEDLTLPSLC